MHARNIAYKLDNSSGICDGAGSILVASESALTENDLKPLARVVAWAVVGCEPSIMGIGKLLLLFYADMSA
jgi:acetyl-CoA acetyltransferase